MYNCVTELSTFSKYRYIFTYKHTSMYENFIQAFWFYQWLFGQLNNKLYTQASQNTYL